MGNLTRTEEHVVFKDDKDIKEGKRLTNFDEVGLELEDRMKKRTRKRESEEMVAVPISLVDDDNNVYVC